MASKAKTNEAANLENYKGIFYDEEPGLKFQDELTGAHFLYPDMCRRLKTLKAQMLRKESESNSSHKGLLIQKQKRTASIFKALPYYAQDSRNGDSHLYGSIAKYSMGKTMKKLNNRSIGCKRLNKYIKEGHCHNERANYKNKSEIRKM